MTAERPGGVLRASRAGLIAVLMVVVVVVALGTFYFSGRMSTSSSTTQYAVVESVTVFGRPSGFPCSALRLPCPFPTNQSAIPASLVLYDGKYYYISNITANSVMYTVWYDNSTYYCVSPKFQGVNTCPP